MWKREKERSGDNISLELTYVRRLHAASYVCLPLWLEWPFSLLLAHLDRTTSSARCSLFESAQLSSGVERSLPVVCSSRKTQTKQVTLEGAKKSRAKVGSDRGELSSKVPLLLNTHLLARHAIYT